MMSEEGFTKIVNFMTSRAGILMLGRGHIVNMPFTISSPLLVYNRAWIRQNKYKAILAKEGSSTIVNFITIGAGGLMVGHGYISH